MFSYKLFNIGEEKLLAISDISLLGKKFEEKGLQLEVSKDFYSGNTCKKEDAINLIKGATIINAVGDNIIELMLKHKLVEKDNLLRIGGVPHAQIIYIRSS